MTVGEIIKKARERMEGWEGGDYKDHAASLSRAIRRICLEHGIPVPADMPDGFCCPRAFGDWVSNNEEENENE